MQLAFALLALIPLGSGSCVYNARSSENNNNMFWTRVGPQGRENCLEIPWVGSEKWKVSSFAVTCGNQNTEFKMVQLARQNETCPDGLFFLIELEKEGDLGRVPVYRYSGCLNVLKQRLPEIINYRGEFKETFGFWSKPQTQTQTQTQNQSQERQVDSLAESQRYYNEGVRGIVMIAVFALLQKALQKPDLFPPDDQTARFDDAKLNFREAMQQLKRATEKEILEAAKKKTHYNAKIDTLTETLNKISQIENRLENKDVQKEESNKE